MSSMEIAKSAGSNDPAIGLRAVASLRRLTEQLESLQVDRLVTLDGLGPKLLANSVSPNKRSTKSMAGSRDHREEGVRDMFERFTQEAKAILVEAQDLQ